MLERDFFELFRTPLQLNEVRIHNQIVSLIRSEGVTRSLSTFVELRVDRLGEQEILICGASLYDGYAFRCISPTAQVVLVESPFGMLSTSARRSTLALAGELSLNIGGEVALECDSRNRIHSIGGAALFAAGERRLISSPSVRSVERGLVIEAAKALRIPTEEREIWNDELPHFDELFCCDHQGILAISRLDTKPYMSIIAQKIGSALTQPWM